MATGPTGTTDTLKRIFRSTKNQLILVMLVLVISTGVIATAVSMFHAKADLEKQISVTMDAVTRDTVDQLQLIFIAGTDDANQLALNPRVIDILETEKRAGIDPRKRQAMVPELDAIISRTSAMITDIRIVNRDGEVIASSDPSDIGTSERTDPVFISGLGNTTIGDPYLNNKNVPSLSYAAPVTGSSNETLGVVMVSGPLDFVENNVLRPDNLGTSGRLYLVNKDGVLISGVLSDGTTFLHGQADLARIQVYNVTSFTDYRGFSVIGMAAPVTGTSWTLVVTEDESEAMAPVQNLMVSMIVLITGIVIIDGLVAWYIAHQVAETEKALTDSERSLTDIINFLPDATLAIDRQGMVIAWNLAIEELTGVKAADMLGKGDFAYAVPLYGEKRPILIDLIFEPDEVITKKYSGIIHKTGNLLIAETTLPGLKGKRRVAWAMASPLYDDEGRVVGAIESIRDITDRKQAEEALRQANRKLNLLSSITRHDILNQLTAVRGYLELAYLNAGDDAGREHVRKAQEAAETIEDQISFTKSYEEIGVHSPVWQNTADLVKKVLSDLRSPPLSCTVDLDNLEVYADPLLEKVFFTFVENSVRHGEHATEIRFSFSVLGSGDLILVYEDNGVGISHYDKEHLFERGYGKNTGLGLFLSREILAITGLTVRETGEPGKGVRFEILVPKEGYRFTPGVLNNQ